MNDLPHLTGSPVVCETLPNGLVVLLKEIHTAPIISHWIWYRVGSRDESTGRTGISHWTEHMQFKGTPRFPARVPDRQIARQGGVWNAFTHLDWTTYFETLPAHAIDIAQTLEADRMINSLYNAEDVESERTVIISERQGSENEPLFLLGEEVQAAAFRVHPYHHEIIGDMADLQTIQRDNLYSHYQAFYLPNNAVLTMAGDFSTGPMLEYIHREYGSIPAGPPPPRLQRPEPPQNGERRVVVEGPGETTFAELAFHAPAAAEADFFACTVLDSLLTGPSNLNLFGGGISNKTSRLYRTLVESELAVHVHGGLQATIDPYLYTILITIRPGRETEETIAAVEQEIDKLQQSPPLAAEVERAVKQARALFAYGSESITNQAYWLGFSEMFADYSWFTGYLERLAAVTPQEIQKAAQDYLRPQNRVTGIYLPDGRV
jgi:zinc protease